MNLPHRSRLLWFVLLLLSWVVQSPRAHAEPVTPEQAAWWAQQLEAALARGEVDQVAATLDTRALLQRATRGLPDGPRKQQVIEGVSTQLAQSFPEQMVGYATGGNSYRLLRVRQTPDGPQPIFRYLHRDTGGYNYHVMHLATDRAGRDVRLVDMDIMATGELWSQTIRRMVLPALERVDKEGGDEGGDEGGEARLVEYARRTDILARANAAGNAGRFQEALQLLDTLPASMRDDRTPLMLRVLWNGQLRLPDAQQAALKRYRELYPEASNINLMSIDAYRMSGDTQRALAAIDRLDRSVGGDPYLAALRATVLVERGDEASLARARAELHRAMDEASDLPELRRTAVVVAMAQRDYAAVAEQLLDLERGGETIADLAATPGYEPFVESDAYADWQRRRPTSAGGG